MKLVVGLGNPGRRYANSRHNIGFMAVEELARRWRLSTSGVDKKFEAAVVDGPVAGVRTLLAQPATFMNLSGRSVSAIVRFYKLPLSDVLIVHDDLDLPLGRIRLRAGGSAGGQKGMADVIRQCGTDEIARLRVGIGKTHPSATVEYVLSSFLPEERETAELVVQLAADAVERWLQTDIQTAMNEFNGRDAR